MKHRAATAAFSILLGLGLSPLARAETKSYVVSWFYMATYSQEGDCPDGLNPNIEQNFRRILAELGKPQDEIEKLVKGIPNTLYTNLGARGRIDGTPVSPYLYPTSVADPHIKILKGKTGYGFDLDGGDGPDDFVDPETHQGGVDNQLYRVLGCFVPDRAFPPDRPGYPAAMWDMPRDAMPAWLVEVSGIDPKTTSGDVTVGIYRATAPITRDTAGQPIPDMTFRVADEPRSTNVVHGHLERGVITTDKFEFKMLGDTFFQPNIRFRDARLRLTLKDDGTARGILGGYQDVAPLYASYALGGLFNEAVVSLDVPGIWYALKRMADAYPDTKSGENSAISSAYAVELVPAFIVHSAQISAVEAK
jgi:hypothetical protein